VSAAEREEFLAGVHADVLARPSARRTRALAVSAGPATSRAACWPAAGRARPQRRDQPRASGRGSWSLAETRRRDRTSCSVRR